MEAGDAETTSLMRWLSFYAATEKEACVEIVCRLLGIAFPAAFKEKKWICGWEAVISTLEGFYETSVVVDVKRLEKASFELNETLRTVLELVLGAVVQCDEKGKFVKDILTMEDGVQADLMTIIERVMSKGASEVTVNDAKEVQETEEKRSNGEQLIGMGSPLYLSKNAALARTERENGVLKEENAHLAQELEGTSKRCRDLEDEKVKLVEMIRQLKDQLDSDVLRKERSVQALYDERMQVLQRKLDRMETELRTKTELANNVPVLQDELDLLRPLAEKMVKMDATVAKYKTKVDELSGAKEALRRLEGTNVALMEKNLALECELAKAASGHRKLKEAKEAKTAMEFRVSELETLLARERHELAAARADFESVRSALQETNMLNTQLQKVAGQRLSNDATDSSMTCSAPAMSEGISELNPELMQKLARLEFENAQLRKQINGEISARIDELVDQIEDITRLKKSFETKFFDTRQTLESTQSELEHVKRISEKASKEFQARITKLIEWQTCLQEDILAGAAEKQNMAAVRDDLAKKLGDCADREKQLSQIVTTQTLELTEAKDAKKALSSQIERLKQQCECLSLAKEELLIKLELRYVKWRELETARLDATKELERYKDLHSVSNADWRTKEEELYVRVNDLKELCDQYNKQEQKLKSTIKSQLQSNARIVEKNNALKADAIEKRETIARLEATTTRLKSKLSLLEREQAHFSAQEKRRQNMESGISSFSSQLSTQVSLVAAELEKVLKENKELHHKRDECRCGRESSPGGAVSDKKNYYLSRLQQLELDKQQVEHKRRELLLVNAKLIQEQKQLHIKNISLSDHVHELEESINHWRLREERRKKKAGQPSLPVETEYKFTSPLAKKSSAQAKSGNNDLQDDHRAALMNSDTSLSSAKSDTTNLLDCHSNCTSSSTRKRKLHVDDGIAAPETTRSTSKTNSTARGEIIEPSDSISTPAAAASSTEPRPKRRLSRFITRSFTSNQQSDKPSECQQQ